MQSKTIIVGGGIAGISCALHLLEGGEEFTLITDDIGGRVSYSPQKDVNYGAYFIMSNYSYAKKIVEKDKWINPFDACFHNNDGKHFSAISWHTLANVPQFLKFIKALLEFKGHYEIYKERCLHLPQKEVLADNLYLYRLFHLPAAEYIKERKIERVTADYVSKFAYACTGADINTISAFDFLNVCLGLVLPIYQLKFSKEDIINKIGNNLIFDSITNISGSSEGHVLTGNNCSYQAENIVLATPAEVTQRLLKLSEIRGTCKIYVYHVKAKLKPQFVKNSLNMFPFISKIILTAKQKDGTYLIYSREKNTDLSQVCWEYQIIDTKDWDNAMYVYGRAYIEQEYGNCIYVAGDHNGLGLEPSAISGIYAANKIIERGIMGD